jgi:hypothetical protein
MSSLTRLHAPVVEARSRANMSVVLGVVGVLICIVLIGKGYLWPVLIGGTLGSFVGIAGFGGAVSGVIPGAIVGALVAKAMK